MKDKDKIEELFQKELGNYQAKVEPQLWNGIQAGLANSAGVTSTSSLSLAAKTIAGAIAAGGIVVGAFVYFNQNTPSNTSIQETPPLIIDTVDTIDAVEDTIASDIELEEKVLETPEYSLPKRQMESKNLTAPIINESRDKYKYKKATQVAEHPLETVGEADKQTENRSETIFINPAIVVAGIDEVPHVQETSHAKVDLSNVQIEVLQQKNQYIQFNIQNLSENANVVWNFGDGNFNYTQSPEHFFNEAGVYEVILTVNYQDEEVVRKRTVEIAMEGKIGVLPNVFTPNGDGKNDVLYIETEHLKTFQLTIMDNNQNVVFATNDANFKWYGIDMKGSKVEDGNYIYIIVAEDEAGNLINKYQQLTIYR